MGLCEGLLETGPEIGVVNREQLTEYVKMCKELAPEAQSLSVRFCRSMLGYETGQAKLIVALRGCVENVRAPLVSALSQSGDDLKTRRAPCSGMERALQTFLDTLEFGKSRRLGLGQELVSVPFCAAQPPV